MSHSTPFKSKKAKATNGFAKIVLNRVHVDEMIHNDTLYRSSESEGSLMVEWSGKTVKIERGDERLAEITIKEEFECTVSLSAPLSWYSTDHNRCHFLKKPTGNPTKKL